MNQPFGSLILAAGKGTRMKSRLPKVLHPVCALPMLEWVLRASDALSPAWTLVVAGSGAAEVQRAFAGRAEFVLQEPQLGSGHAVMQAQPFLRARGGDVLVLMGDVPLLRPRTLQALLDERRSSGAACVVLTAEPPDPAAYGRVLRGADGCVEAIREHRDASEAERAVREINTGIYVFDGALLAEHIGRLSDDNAQGEFYLTDMVTLFRQAGLAVRACRMDDFREVSGINDRADLAEAEREMRRRVNLAHMRGGVTLVDPERTDIGPDVRIAADVVVYPNVTLRGATRVAAGCEIRPGSWLENAVLEENVRVDCSLVCDSSVGRGTTVGPFAHIRGGAAIGPENRVGNFVEIKKTVTGEHTKASHLAYLGDAEIGSRVNVGAGTITCNYDGVHKHRTVIGDGAFIGSDSILVAPVSIGRNATTAAASAITLDVPDGALGIGRERQVNIADYYEKKRESLKKSSEGGRS